RESERETERERERDRERRGKGPSCHFFPISTEKPQKSRAHRHTNTTHTHKLQTKSMVVRPPTQQLNRFQTCASVGPVLVRCYRRPWQHTILSCEANT